MAHGIILLFDTRARYDVTHSRVSRERVGQLTLTSKRIIFEGFKGHLYRETETLVNLPLTGIEDVAVEGRFQKRVALKIRSNVAYSLPATLSFQVNNSQQWKKQIMEQSSAATTDQLTNSSTAPISTPATQSAQTMADTSNHLHQTVIARICPQCGSTLDEEDKFCPYCGRAFSICCSFS